VRAIVTGAAGGIGLAICRELAGLAGVADAPAQLALIDVDFERLARARAEVEGLGVAALALAGDLTDEAFIERAVGAATDRFGGLDALISNAGIFQTGSLLEADGAGWDRAFAINVRAAWQLAVQAHDALAASAGAIVATASLAATQPVAGHGAYSASKAALVMLVRQLACEWGPDGIRANCVSPGTVHTPMTDGFYSDAANKRDRARHIPLRRVSEPDDIAAVVAFLVSPAARYMTGQDLVVDGGLDTMLMTSVRGGLPAPGR
jgi:NAD(P)-dependent dehydrogenase (short-subunit alcohol dehydrogenase family)